MSRHFSPKCRDWVVDSAFLCGSPRNRRDIRSSNRPETSMRSGASRSLAGSNLLHHRAYTGAQFALLRRALLANADERPDTSIRLFLSAAPALVFRFLPPNHGDNGSIIVSFI